MGLMYTNTTARSTPAKASAGGSVVAQWTAGPGLATRACPTAARAAPALGICQTGAEASCEAGLAGLAGDG